LTHCTDFFFVFTQFCIFFNCHIITVDLQELSEFGNKFKGSFTKVVYGTFSKILDDFFVLSYVIFAMMVRLQIYTYCRPFRSSMFYVASRALPIAKTTYRETTSFILSHFFQLKYRFNHPMRQKFSWETNSCSASQKIPIIYTKLRFFTVFTVLEISSYTEPAESSLHFQIWLCQPIPKSKIDGAIHFSSFPVSLILVAYNKTSSFNSCILVPLHNLYIAIGKTQFLLQQRLLKISSY
jgi:hypothetical protein